MDVVYSKHRRVNVYFKIKKIEYYFIKIKKKR